MGWGGRIGGNSAGIFRRQGSILNYIDKRNPPLKKKNIMGGRTTGKGIWVQRFFSAKRGKAVCMGRKGDSQGGIWDHTSREGHQ